MNKIVHTLIALVLPVIARADASPPRLVIQSDTIASGAAVPVQTNLGLGGVVAGAAVPASTDTIFDSTSKCTHGRHASISSWSTGRDWIGATAEVMSIGGREVLDEGEVANDGDDHIKVTTHTRRPITRIATLGDEVAVWAYRQNGMLVIGAFTDFGEMDRVSSIGCRWRTFTLPERGGTGMMVSRPRFSDPKTYDVPSRETPHGPSFSIAASVSRSSSDASPMLVVRATSLRD